ncbi:hypothetical protein HYT23_03525 [Candidatus Pacearchaeota archaeon]|nr:hypothetical protein [Candidatus Pacearchaeota archaeon]
MPERILYVYAGDSEIPPYDEHGMNFTELIVDGRKVDTTAGLDDERIKNEVRMKHNNGAKIILNQHPRGEALTRMLNSDLENRINNIIVGEK